MANPIEYIVYEPDQVLTNDHLNETFNYLDQQNRWTRNKLIGIGVVCGLEIVLNTGVIRITKGCGVTSQGYLITQDDTQYTYYIPYSSIAVPNDLPFTYTNGNLPFYTPFCTGKNIWLLLSDDQYNALESAQQLTAKTLSSAAANFLSDYVVVLFLEANETDLKNCDMQDCNNKGEKMAFQVRPLLVAKTDLPGAAVAAAPVRTPVSTAPVTTLPVTTLPVSVIPINIANLGNILQVLSPQVNLKRFNVPYADLNNATDVINAFVKQVDDTTLTQLANTYTACYSRYSSILKVTANPFTTLATDLKNYRTLILQQNPIFIEYFYDFVDDLIKAYNEFITKVSGVISTCCPDENLFPLHLILGAASTATNALVKDGYRNYFIYSPLFAKMGTESAEVILLFKRMVLMVQNFNAQNAAITRLSTIQITPSQYELPPLSERAIPYYYNLNVSGSELYKAWNYYKTLNGYATLNLSYNANLYNSNTAITQPLLYDIEKYNFFRVEGHIGQNYQTVLSNLLSQRQNYNLPIDVVAISADLLTSGAALPDCNFQDLDTGYKLILSEAACKIHTTFCYLSKLPYTPPVIRFPIFNLGLNFTNLTLVNSTAETLLKANDQTKTPKATVSTGISEKGNTPIIDTAAGTIVNQPVNTGISNTGAATTVNTGATIDVSNVIAFSTFKLNMAAMLEPVSTSTAPYAKGDFMRTYCAPVVNTIGNSYLAGLNSAGVFTNPIQIDQSNPLTIAYYYFFQYLDAVEQLFYVLNTNTLNGIDMTAFANEYVGYQSITATIISYLSSMAEQKAAIPGAAVTPYVTLAEATELEMLVGELDILTSICIDERLQVLKNEYTRRLTNYQQQQTFLNYYKNHPGLEHKAGVPKGGTLVLVYHSATQTIATGPIINTPIINFPVGNFPITTANPITTNPVATNPIATNPIATNPVATNPVATNPIATNPVATNPIATNPIVTTNPVANNPITTTPVTTTPIVTAPITTANPVATNPVTVTEPVKVTMPVTTPIKTSPVMMQHAAVASPVLMSTTANPVLATTAINPVLTSTIVNTGVSAPVSAINTDTLNQLKTFVGTLNTTDAQKQLLINLLGTQPVQTAAPTYQIADGAVIADFYIPYLCCSDCPPIAYLVPPPVTTTPTKPVVTIATQFCDTDTKAEAIKVSIPGGTFNTVKGLDGTKLTFTPATAGAGTYSIVYTVNGVSSDAVKVTVLPTPVNTFTMAWAFNDKQQMQATFTPDSQNAAFKYQWTFGPGFSVTTSTDEIPVVIASFDPTTGAAVTSTVTLLVTNGKCSEAAESETFSITPNGVNPVPATGTIKGNFQSLFGKKKKKE